MKIVKCPNCGNDIVVDESNPELHCSCGKVYKNKYYVNPDQLVEIGEPAYQYANNQSANYTKIEKKSIGLVILLSIITCGIYALVWFVKLTNDTNEVSGSKDATSGGMALLLTLVTCGIYEIYWAYKQGEKLDIAKQNYGMPSKDSAILYLVLTIFGLGIVANALMQSQLNDIADHQ